MQQSFVLVANERSGSFDQDTVDAILDRANELGLGTARPSILPDCDCPTAADLGPHDIVAVFAGDGTVNSLVQELEGWTGSVLILPGGTMNLAAKRLHGDRSWQDILEAVGKGEAIRTRLPKLCTNRGDALAGVMLGPGTSWNDVREAMRDVDLAAIASSTVTAFAGTNDGARVVCVEPEIGRREGYPLIEVQPCEGALEFDAYHADDAGEFVVGLSAVLTHNFRAGPHETFTSDETLRFEAQDGSPIGILLDGEPVEESPAVTISLGTCGVDLLATRRDD